MVLRRLARTQFPIWVLWEVMSAGGSDWYGKTPPSSVPTMVDAFDFKNEGGAAMERREVARPFSGPFPRTARILGVPRAASAGSAGSVDVLF